MQIDISKEVISEMKQLKALVVKVNNVLENLGVVMLCICTLGAIVGVIMRYVFNSPFNWIEELSALSLCWLVFIYQPKLENDYNHLTMTVLYNAMGKGYKKFIRIIQSILTLAFSGYLFYYAVKLIQMNILTKQATVALNVPWWIMYLSMVFYFGCIIIIHLLKIFTNDFGLSEPEKKGDVETC